MTDEQQQQAAAAGISSSADESPRRLRGRIAAAVWSFRQDWLTKLLVLGGVGTAVFGLGIAYRWTTLKHQQYAEREISLTVALAQLDAGAIEAARETAAELRSQETDSKQLTGGPTYVLGAAMIEDAVWESDPRERRSLYLLAARYLEESREAGFPAGREGHGEHLLGTALFKARHYAAAVPALQRALEAYPSHEAEIHSQLATAYLRHATPQLPEAHRHNALFLAATREPGAARDKALLLQAEIEFQLGKDTACLETLEQIAETSDLFAAAALLRGRLRLQEGDMALGDDELTPEAAAAKAGSLYSRALDAFQDVRRQHAGNSDLVRQAQYLIGLTHRKLGDFPRAESQFSKTRRSNYDTSEGLAAGLHEAELQMLQGRHDESILAFSRVFRQAADLPVYSNRWVTLDELQRRAEQAYRAFYQAGDYPRAIQMARALAPIFVEETALQLQADAFRARAEELQRTARRLPPSQADAVIADARGAWREAAALFEKLARLRFATRAYPETLWDSAKSYLSGHDYRRATRLLKAYLENEVRRRHPPALAALGEAYLALDEPGKALQVLDECIEFFPKDPHAYRARLVASQACSELGNLERARRLLIANLEHEDLTPRSVEWRESLGALGAIYYREGLERETRSRLDGIDSEDPELHREAVKHLEQAHANFQRSIELLAEAVQRDELAERDPFNSETLKARYLIAESHRQSAKLPLHRLSTVTIETTRNQLNSQIQRELSAAETAFHQLQTLLNAKQEASELTRGEHQLLRNSYFARADVLYDLENLEAAISAYATATNRYQHEPEALEAYVQIANCHRLLNRPAEARGMLEQAKVVLENIRDEADFTETTRYSRQEWEVLLNWLTSL